MKTKKERIKSPFERLKKEHLIIIEELFKLEKNLIRIGGNLDSIKGFLALFDDKIKRIIDLEESVLFPYLRGNVEENKLFVMTYTHEIIENEFEKLRKALLAEKLYDIHSSGDRLIKILRFHIENEDAFVIEKAKEIMKLGQINRFSGMLLKLGA